MKPRLGILFHCEVGRAEIHPFIVTEILHDVIRESREKHAPETNSKNEPPSPEC